MTTLRRLVGYARRSFITVMVCGLFCWPAPYVCAQTEKQLRVTVISVTEFDDPQLRNTPLTKAVQDTTAKLVDFFSSQFGVVPRVLQTRDGTTAEALRKWLFYDLSRDSSRSIHLVFVLTHGIGYQYSGATIFKNELFLASSDTKSDDYFGVAIRGSELIDAFQRLTRGSSVFLFLDTCGSGSIDNSGISQLLEADRSTGTRMMILAGSFSDENAFRARFTRALLNIWQTQETTGNECHSGETGQTGIPNFVDHRMTSLDPLDPKFTQTVSLVFSYTNDFCIESFASGTALALLGNPTDEEVSIVLKRTQDATKPISFRIKSKAVKPVILHRATYTADVQPVFSTSSLHSTSVSLDLAADFVQYQALYPSGPLDLAVNQQQAVASAEASGAPEESVTKLNDLAREQFLTALNSVHASVELSEVNINLQKTALQDAESKKEAQDKEVAESVTALSATEHTLINKHHMNGIVDLQLGFPLSAQEISLLENSRHRVEQAQKDSTLASTGVEDEKRRLSQAEELRALIEGQTALIQSALNEFAVAASHRQAKQHARAKLSESLSAIFSTQDTRRGLVVSLPQDSSDSQLNSLGNVLASFGGGLLVEAEVEVTGANIRKNQELAGTLASSIREKLLRHTGLSPNMVVSRGFGGAEKGKKITQSIIVSGDPIGK